MKKIILLILIVLAVVFYLNFSLFVIPPMAAFPEGVTFVTDKQPEFKFIDSTDGYLLREQGSVGIKQQVAVVDKVSATAKIYARLPYIKLLYMKSIGEPFSWNRWFGKTE